MLNNDPGLYVPKNVAEAWVWGQTTADEAFSWVPTWNDKLAVLEKFFTF